MMQKELASRIVHKHDIETNWNKATTFIPKQGEMIVYDIDDLHDYERIKIGDGVTAVTELPFYQENVAYINASDNETITDPEVESSSISVDSYLSNTSTNPVQNKVVTAELSTLSEQKLSKSSITQEAGQSESLVMSQKAVTEQFARLNPLYGKKVSFLGDSICAGSENTHVGGYGKIIAERNNMVYENLARGGSTITAETYTHSEPISAKGWICRMVDSAAVDADYVIVEGGINDASQWRNYGDIAIGEITEGYTAVLDDTTYYGAFESMLKRLVTRFAGKKIGYIAIPKTNDFFDSEKNVPNFYHIALECCAKWGVPVCDLNTITPPTSYLYSLGTEYTPDGVHQNYEGYIKYYCDPIESWMKTLTTGGNNSATVARKAVEEYTKGFNDAITALQNGKLDNKGISFKKAKLTLVDGTVLEIDVLTAVDGTVVIPYVNRIPISIDTDGTTYGEDYNGDGENDGYLKGKRLSSSGALKDAEGSYVTGYIQAKGRDEIRIFGCGWGTKLNAMNYICAYDENFNFIGAGATTAGVETTTLKSYTATVATLKSVSENADTTLTLADNSNIAYIRISTRGDAQSYDTNLNFANAIVTVNEPIT